MADDTPSPAPQLDLLPSRQLPSWLTEMRVSLAFTTYQSGKLFLIGVQPNGRLSIFERTFNRCVGMWCDGQTLYISTLYQLWRFENCLAPGEAHDGYDRLYVPRVAWTTGDVDVHDIAVGSQVIFVNTLFGCLASVSDTHSFKALRRPKFLSKLAAEDRCHLNGLALAAGRPRYVTAVSDSDVADDWRDQRRDGGVVIDVETNDIVGRGLSMPHSPRWYRDKLWLLDSGNGQFGYLDLANGRFQAVTFCPGYLRGLSFIGDYAVVGTSLPRDNKTFQGLALDSLLAGKDTYARCGLHVIDLRSGDLVHWLRIDGFVQEIYDVAILWGVQRPMALGFKTHEIRRTLSVGPAQ